MENNDKNSTQFIDNKIEQSKHSDLLNNTSKENIAFPASSSCRAIEIMIEYIESNDAQRKKLEKEYLSALKSLNSNDALLMFNFIDDALKTNTQQKWSDKLKDLIRKEKQPLINLVEKYVFTLYPIFKKLQMYIPQLNDVSSFLTSAEVAVNGRYSVEKDCIRKIPPTDSDKIFFILDYLVENNEIKEAEKWVKSILCTPITLACYTDNFIEKAKTTRKELIDRINNTNKYQIFSNILELSEIKTAVQDKSSTTQEFPIDNTKQDNTDSDVTDDTYEISKLREELDNAKKLLLDLDIKLKNKDKELLDKELELERNNASCKRISNQLDDLNKRYLLQIKINESLEESKNILIEEKNHLYDDLCDEYDLLQEKNDALEDKIQMLNITNNNLLADFEREKISNEKYVKSNITENNNIREEFLSDIIIAIKDQLENFGKAFALFKKESQFDPYTLSFCEDGLEDIISKFEEFGASTIGRYNEITTFNRNLHYYEGSIEENHPVRIVNIGWKVGDTVISKASVEVLKNE